MTQFEARPEVIRERVRFILRAAGGEMSAKAFCEEHIKRGWALADLTPEILGFEDSDVITLTPGPNEQRTLS